VKKEGIDTVVEAAISWIQRRAHRAGGRRLSTIDKADQRQR
jgi:hypothetical protein